MPGRGVNAPRLDGGSVDDSVVAIPGSIRNPDEVDALSVTLSMSGIEIAMRTDEQVLGTWPCGDVAIRSLDSTQFEFIVEGDRLIFVPDDPAALGDIPFVTVPTAKTRGRKGRRSRKKSDETGSKPLPDGELTGDDRPPGIGHSAHVSPDEKPPKPSRRERRAAARAERVDATPAPPSPVPASISVLPEPEQPVSDEMLSDESLPGASVRGDVPPEQELDTTPQRGTRERLNSAWLRSLDVARKYDIFGLDRVPIDEGLRGQEHQHTWDHRVAAESGAGQHICTICGMIRR